MSKLTEWVKRGWKATLVAVVLAFVSSGAYAASTGNVNVTKISSGSSGDVFVKTTGTFTNPAPCSNTSLYVLPFDHGAKKELLAVMLTSAASAGGINLFIENIICTTIGAQTYATIFKIEYIP